MAQMKKIPEYTEWALSIKPGDKLIIHDNSYVQDKEGRPQCLYQLLEKDYRPTNNEYGADFIVQANPKIITWYTAVPWKTKDLPTVRVKSTKTKIEYQVGICWPDNLDPPRPKISKAQYYQYEALRREGYINMLDLEKGTQITGLSPEDYKEIQLHYNEYKELYPIDSSSIDFLKAILNIGETIDNLYNDEDD